MLYHLLSLVHTHGYLVQARSGKRLSLKLRSYNFPIYFHRWEKLFQLFYGPRSFEENLQVFLKAMLLFPSTLCMYFPCILGYCNQIKQYLWDFGVYLWKQQSELKSTITFQLREGFICNDRVSFLISSDRNSAISSY